MQTSSGFECNLIMINVHQALGCYHVKYSVFYLFVFTFGRVEKMRNSIEKAGAGARLLFSKKKKILVVSQVLLGKFKGTGLEMPFPY